MMHTATFSLADDRAGAIYRALVPECDETGTRTETALHLSRQESVVTVTVHSADIIALRAALNTWLRLMNIAKEMQEIDTYG